MKNKRAKNTDKINKNFDEVEIPFFYKDNKVKAKKIMERYPIIHSAAMPLLHLAQEQNGGWISSDAIEAISQMLDIPPIKIKELVDFYTMYNTRPIGKYLIQICRTTPCWLCGSDAVTKACFDELSIKIGETTEDGLFTIVEVECLGACISAPILQINNDYYEKFDYDKTIAILRQIKENEK